MRTLQPVCEKLKKHTIDLLYMQKTKRHRALRNGFYFYAVNCSLFKESCVGIVIMRGLPFINLMSCYH